VYAFGTIDFLNNIFDTGLRSETYDVYVLTSSDYNSIKDLNDKTISIVEDEDDEALDNALQKLAKKIDFNQKSYSNIGDVVDSVVSMESDALFVSDSLMSVYLEEHDDVDLKLIGTIEITVESETEFTAVDVSKKPFVVYISGVDTSGKVNKSARSDVNILAFVNPEKGKVLLVNTPRDYYITLASKNAKDKLTHAGIYGTNESANSLALLYDTEVNYYVRINFTSFVNIIDSLGGITVDVDAPDYRYNKKIDCGVGYVCEQNSNREFGSSMIYIKSGVQTLNGEQALAYARNRYQYAGGDNTRGVHQEQILKAILEKVESPSILAKYNSLLKSLSSGIITNVEQDTITKLVNYQLDNNIKWEIDTYSVKGTDSYQTTYSLGSAKAYVLLPLEDSVNEAKVLIQEIMEG
jgi:LCP family protein required for cell wall assembly